MYSVHISFSLNFLVFQLPGQKGNCGSLRNKMAQLQEVTNNDYFTVVLATLWSVV